MKWRCKKTNSYGPVRNQNSLFLYTYRGKDPEWCETEKYVFCLKFLRNIFNGPVLRVLDYSRSFDIHIKKKLENFGGHLLSETTILGAAILEYNEKYCFFG